MAELPAKAKYSPLTDSAQVPRGKGEKQAGEAGEREPETLGLQRAQARKGECVPIEE